MVKHEDAIETQDGLRVFFEMNQVVLRHELAPVNNELSCFPVELTNVEALNDFVHISVRATDQCLIRSPVLLHHLLDEEPSIVFLKLHRSSLVHHA